MWADLSEQLISSTSLEIRLVRTQSHPCHEVRSLVRSPVTARTRELLVLIVLQAEVDFVVELGELDAGGVADWKRETADFALKRTVQGEDVASSITSQLSEGGRRIAGLVVVVERVLEQLLDGERVLWESHLADESPLAVTG